MWVGCERVGEKTEGVDLTLYSSGLRHLRPISHIFRHRFVQGIGYIGVKQSPKRLSFAVPSEHSLNSGGRLMVATPVVLIVLHIVKV